MQANTEKTSFGERLRRMCKTDFRRMFTQPLLYILSGVCLALPILILVMTTVLPSTSVDPVTGAETAVETFTNTWQAIGAVSGSAQGMNLTSMCNINMLYFAVSVLVCLFVGSEFTGGYAKNLFSVRAGKADYIASKTLVTFVGGAILFVLYFVGVLIGGAIAGLPFTMTGFGAGGLVACMLSKIFAVAVFAGIALLPSVVCKQRVWLSLLCSLAGGMLLYTMIPMITPLDSGFLNVAMCLCGGALFAFGLGAASNLVLKKTDF